MTCTPFRFDVMRAALLLIAFGTTVACSDATAPTGMATATEIQNPLALTSGSGRTGERVETTKSLGIYQSPTRRSSFSGEQRAGARGTIIAGPTAITIREPQPLWQIDFDSGADGWVMGKNLNLVADTPPAPTIATVTVTPATATVVAGANVQLTAVARDASGTVMSAAAFTWRSTDTTRAVVSATGAVLGRATGQSAIIATSGGRADTSVVTVTAAIAPVATVTVTQSSATLAAGTTTQLTATVRDAAGNVLTGRTIDWSSSAASTATVSSSGLVSAVAAGSATITATSEGRSGASSISVTGTALVGPTRIHFASDFATALGGGDAAMRDVGSRTPWNMRGGTGGEIVPASGLDFPTANVLRITDTWAFLRTTNVPVPAVGERLSYRWYMRVTVRDGLSDNQTHPMQDGFDASSSNWMWEVRSYPDRATAPGTWRALFRLNATTFPLNKWELPVNLAKNVTYRFEHLITRTGALTFTLESRVYSASGVLLYSDADFTNAIEGGTSRLSSRPTLTLLNVANLNGFNAGVNGVTGAEGTYGYQGGFAICNDWCGPYRAGETRP